MRRWAAPGTPAARQEAEWATAGTPDRWAAGPSRASDRTRPRPKRRAPADRPGRRARRTPRLARAPARGGCSFACSLLAEPLGGGALVVDLMSVEEVEVHVVHVLVEESRRVGERSERHVTLGAGQLHLYLWRVGVHHGDVAHVGAAAVGESQRAALRAAGVAHVHRQRATRPREGPAGEAVGDERRCGAHRAERVYPTP